MANRTPMIRWLPKPEEQDYPAAFSYLKLHYTPKRSRALVKELEAARMTEFKAKDIFRASCLPLLGISNLRVESDRKKIARQEKDR